MTSTSEDLFEAAGGSFSDVSVILPKSWMNTECVDGVEVSNVLSVPEGFDSADFKVGGGPHPVFGPGPRAAGQFGPCGVGARDGVVIPAHVLVSSENVTEEHGKWIDYYFRVCCTESGTCIN